MYPNYLNNFIAGHFIASLYCTYYAVILITNQDIFYFPLNTEPLPSFETNVGVIMFLTDMALNF